MENIIKPLEAKNVKKVITPEDAADMLRGPFGCGWKGCQANYTGDMPPGWRCIGIYKKDILDGEIDGVLCPVHLRELGKMLKAGYTLDLAVTEESRSSN